MECTFPVNPCKHLQCGIYIPNECKHFKVVLQLFYGSEANSHNSLKNEKLSGIERLVLLFPDT